MNIETAGARLKKIRQERGLALEDIQKKTKIHLNILRAIEGDSISDLSPIYLKGFIKLYCACLGVDPKDYTSEVSAAEKPVLNATVGRPIGERIEKKPSFLKDASVKLSAIKPSFKFKKAVIFLAAGVIFLFLAVKLVKFISSRPKAAPERAALKSKTPVAVERKISKAIAVKAGKAAVSEPKSSQALLEGFTLGIFAKDKSWISAKVDGKTIFHGVLARGRSQTWHAKEKVELSLGDAAAVELQVNDQRFANLGRRGKPLKNVLINKDGLKISR